MKRLTARAIISGGSAMYESFSNIIQDGNFVTDCAKFWTKFTQRCHVLNSRIEIRESIRDSRCKDATLSILFALVFFRRHYAIVNCVCMKHYRHELKEKEPDPQACRGDGS